VNPTPNPKVENLDMLGQGKNKDFCRKIRA
jgi:hypothetical protein